MAIVVRTRGFVPPREDSASEGGGIRNIIVGGGGIRVRIRGGAAK